MDVCFIINRWLLVLVGLKVRYITFDRDRIDEILFLIFLVKNLHAHKLLHRTQLPNATIIKLYPKCLEVRSRFPIGNPSGRYIQD